MSKSNDPITAAVDKLSSIFAPQNSVGPNKMPLETLRVRYQGLFDFDSLYAGLMQWAKNYNYFFHEKSYKHKVPSAAGAEQEIDWVIESNVDEFTKYEYRISFHTWGMKEVQVQVGSRTKSLSQGKIEVKITSILHLDYQKRFKNQNAIARFFSNIFWKLNEGDVVSYHADTMIYRGNNLSAHIRKLLDMEATGHPYEAYLGEN